MINWHQLDPQQALRELNVDASQGLSSPEAVRRLAEYGRNELAERRAKSPWLILWEQLTAPMVLILIVAAIISTLLTDYKDVIAIGVIVVLKAHVMAIRSERLSLFRLGLLSNKPLLAAVILTGILQLGLVYLPFLQSVFRTIALPVLDLALSIAVTAAIFWAVEFEKWFIHRQEATR